MAKAKVTRRRGNAITRWARETSGELRKVSWPSRQEATQLTILVLVVVVLSSSFLGLLDYLFSRLIGYLITLA